MLHQHVQPLFLALLCQLGIAHPLSAQELKADAQAGKAKAAACIACHQLPYSADEKVPRLAGQSADYLLDAMQAYKRGDRQHALMQALAQPLSKQDMADISSYFSQIKPVEAKLQPRQLSTDAIAKRALGERLVNMNNCVSCHGQGMAKPSDNNIPSLSGMSPVYLESALRSYIPPPGQEQGSRRNAMMRYALNITDPKTGKERFFNEQELRAMAEYISSVQHEKSAR